MEKEHDYDLGEFAFEVQPRSKEEFESDAEKEVFQKLGLKIGGSMEEVQTKETFKLLRITKEVDGVVLLHFEGVGTKKTYIQTLKNLSIEDFKPL